MSLSGLSGSSKFYLVSVILSTIKRPVLFISPTKKKAESASKNLSFFLPHPPPVLLKKEPGWGEALFSSKSLLLKERINWLYCAMSGQPVIAEIGALFERIVPRKSFDNFVMEISKGDLLLREEFIIRLKQTGYVETDFVQGRGEISTRGSILDIFSPGQNNPIRLEFIGDEVGSIRIFNIEDQKSIEKIENAVFLPASGIVLDQKSIDRATKYLRIKAEEHGVATRNKLQVIQEIEKGERIPNIEWLLPSFYPKLSSIFDYLPADTLIIKDEPEEILSSVETFVESLPETEAILKKQLKIAPAIQELFFTKDYIRRNVHTFQNMLIRDLNLTNENNKIIRFNAEPISIKWANDGDSPLDTLSEKIE
ncbi:MAG: hypothetical protein ACE10J_06345, partial [Thermodesulfobacteriota bacterium]